MTTSIETEAEIRRLHYAEHWPVGTIARQLGVHEDVVRRVLGLLTPRAPQVPRERLTASYAEFIEQTLKSYPKLRATRLFDCCHPSLMPGWSSISNQLDEGETCAGGA